MTSFSLFHWDNPRRKEAGAASIRYLFLARQKMACACLRGLLSELKRHLDTGLNFCRNFAEVFLERGLFSCMRRFEAGKNGLLP